jgi:hypothetical protein
MELSGDGFKYFSRCYEVLFQWLVYASMIRSSSADTGNCSFPDNYRGTVTWSLTSLKFRQEVSAKPAIYSTILTKIVCRIISFIRSCLRNSVSDSANFRLSRCPSFNDDCRSNS